MPKCPVCRERMREHCEHGKCGWVWCKGCGVECRLRDGKTVASKSTPREKT
jgi:hypothetical protein